MPQNRRELMRRLGIALASLTTLSCAPLTLIRRTPVVTCYAPPPPTKTPMVTCYTVVSLTTATATPVMACYEVAPMGSATPAPPALNFDTPEWDEVRGLWGSFDSLAKQAGDSERGQAALERMTSQHQELLNQLTAMGELDASVADEMQVAFSEAAFHVWRSNAPITCYIPAPYPEYQIQGRGSLVEQAAVLEEMAARSQIDATTVTQAQAAIARDIAYLMLSAEQKQALAQDVVEESGQDSREWPTLEELELQVPPECAEAARILAALLLERGPGV